MLVQYYKFYNSLLYQYWYYTAEKLNNYGQYKEMWFILREVQIWYMLQLHLCLHIIFKCISPLRERPKHVLPIVGPPAQLTCLVLVSSTTGS